MAIRWTSKILATLALALGPQVASAMPGFCGKLDLSRTTNTDLENIVMMNDLQQNRAGLKRGQCGLPGERVRICSSCSETTSEQQMQTIRPMLGDPAHLAWHADWHLLRGSSEPLTAPVFAKAKASGLVPESMSFQNFGSTYAVGGVLAGENFFYMHRLMIKMVQLELAAANLPCFAPWSDLPTSVDDAKWPVPKKFNSPDARTRAVQKLEAMRAQLARFRNPQLLSKISLNRLGEIIEPRLHLELHAFYQSNPVCSPEGRRQGFCDDLVPVQTSPLNKHFWKLHGLIDGLIGDWLKAHGHREIAVKCDGRAGCYEWQGTWIGRYPR